MTGREKILRALSSEGTDAFGAVVCYPNIFRRDRWEDLIDVPYGYDHDGDPERTAHVARAFVEATGLDWVQVAGQRPAAFRKRYVAEERDGRIALVDRETGEAAPVKRPPVGGEAIRAVDVPTWAPESRADIDEQLAEMAEGARALATDGRLDAFRIMRRELPGAFLLYHVWSPFWAMDNYMSFENFMTLGVEKPDLCRHFVERLTEILSAEVLVLEDSGIDAIWIEECMTDQISPAMFAELAVPGNRALVDAARRARLKSFYYFCGDPNGRLDLILDAGADALALEESKKGFTIDIDDIQRQVGDRCALLGNLDAVGVLQKGSQDDLRREIERQLAVARRTGRFVMSAGSPVTPATDPARVREYARIVHET